MSCDSNDVLAEESPPLPPHPTRALPGTAEKIAVMAERVDLGFQPCHPLDARGLTGAVFDVARNGRTLGGRQAV